MIDARRLSKSLATALKDRAHGIPVQPNHSLPLRPAPLLPIRKTLTNCTENLITNCPNITQVLSSDREDNDDDGNGIDEKEKKGENVISEFSEINHREDDDESNELTNRASIGMNFYDSVGKKNHSNEIDGNSDRGNFINGEFKDQKKIRATKSFDGEELRGELKLDENRRKLFEHSDNGCVSSDINKKRRISNSDEKNNLKFENEESKEFLIKKRKLIEDNENVDILCIDKEANILKTFETNNSKNNFPNIMRYIVKDKNNSKDFVSMDDKKKIRDKIIIKSSIILKETLHKPYCLPDCPEAVPIEIAQAINRNDLLKFNRKNIINNDCDKDLLLKKKFKETIDDDKFIETNDIGKEINEDELGFTSLPSMPTLEDGKTDPLSGMLTPPKELVNDEEGDRRSNLIGEAASMLEAEIKKVKELNRVYDDFNEQESIDRIKKFEKKKNEDNLSNISTVFELKIPGRSPELIFINNEKLLPNKIFGDLPDESLAEAATPESLTFGVEPAFDEQRIKTDDELKNVEILDKLIKLSSSQSVQIIDSKEKSFEMSNDNERKKKSPEDVIRERIERLDKKLEKFIKEENNLKFELSQTNDPHRITKLKPKINCARKKKENIEKQLDKLRSKEKSNFEMKIGGGNLPRIQVRKDLIESIPSTILKSEEHVIRSINESDETSMIKSPPIVITISESDTSSSAASSSEEEEEGKEEVEAVETVSKEGEKRLEESSVQPESEITRDTVIAENFTSSAPENIEDVVLDIPESIERFNEAEKTRARIGSNEDYEQTSEIVLKESCEIDSEKLLTVSINEEKKKLTKEFENPVISETVPSKINDSSIVQSINEERSTILEKNNFQNSQLNVPNFNAHNCRRCLDFVVAECQAKSNVAPLSTEINFPSTISSEKKSVGIRTVIEDNRSNVYPSENYPKDYGMRGNFSRDNGGAITDLSSPLQGHSALPLPQSYVQNLTAQGYPPPPFTVPENHQTTQLQIQLPVSKSSSVVNLTSKQEERLKSPILTAHLLTGQGQEVPANLSVGKKIISPAYGKEIEKGNFEYGTTAQIMTAQFPTLGKWVAEQISRKPVVVGSSPNFNTTLNQSTVYKQLGSDRYKMTASAVDIASHHPPPSETVPSMWRPNPDQQIVTTIPGNPDNQINKQNSYYRRDNQQFINPQNNHHLPNYQSSLYNMKNGGYPGAEMMMPTIPYAVHPSRQNFHMTNNVNVNEHPGVVGQQRVWHYQSATTGIRPNKNNNNGNPIGILPQQQHQQQQQQYHHLQQFQQPIAPASSSSSSNVKIQSAITKNLNQNQGNSSNKVTSNGRKKKFIENYSARYYNSQIENSLVPGTGRIYHEQRCNTNLFLPNPTVVNGVPTYITFLQDQRIDNGRPSLSSSGSINFGTVYPSQVSAAASQPINYLKCLKCSRPAPKFNCADCEVASYCNEYCQRSHWPTHSIECRKKMPKLKKVN